MTAKKLFQLKRIIHLIFIGPCITVIVENKKNNLISLTVLFHFLCAQHVLDINISIIRSSQLFCLITTLVMCSWFDVCWCFGVVGLTWYPCCRLKPATWIPLQPNHTETPTHIEPRTHDQCGNSTE